MLLLWLPLCWLITFSSTPTSKLYRPELFIPYLSFTNIKKKWNLLLFVTINVICAATFVSNNFNIYIESSMIDIDHWLLLFLYYFIVKYSLRFFPLMCTLRTHIYYRWAFHEVISIENPWHSNFVVYSRKHLNKIDSIFHHFASPSIEFG